MSDIQRILSRQDIAGTYMRNQGTSSMPTPL